MRYYVEAGGVCWRGNPIAFVGDVCVYRSDGVLVADEPDRACGHCKLPNTPEGHDGCLGTIEGAINACCGHGGSHEGAYVQSVGGLIFHGELVIDLLTQRKRRA